MRILLLLTVLVLLPDPRAVAQSTPEAKAHYEEGKRAFQSRMFGPAVEAYTAAIQLDTSYSEAYVDRGNVYLALGKFDRALIDYSQAIAIEDSKPQSTDRKRVLWRAYTNRGSAYRRTSDYAKAIADYDLALVLKPDAQLTYMLRGFAYLSSGDKARGDVDLIKASQLAGETEATYLQLARQSQARNEKADALTYAYRALLLNPRSDQAYTIRGEVQVDSNPEQAATEYLKALEINPRNTLALSGMGGVETARHNAQKARKYLEDALKVDGASAVTYVRMGTAATTFGSGDSAAREALTFYGKAIELDPKIAVAYYDRGVIYLGMKENEKAVAELTKAIELDSSNAEAWNNRAIAYKRQGKNDLALADYTKAIDVSPNYSSAFYNRAKLHEAMGSLPDALRDICQACRLNPTDEDARSYQAQLFRASNVDPNAIFTKGVELLNADNFDGAIAQFTQLIDYAAHLPQALYNRALAYQGKREYVKVREDLEEVVRLEPKLIMGRMLLGFTLGVRLNEPDAAAVQYQKVIELDPNHASAYSGLGDTLYDRKAYKDALGMYQKAAALNPMLASAFSGKGRTYYRLQEWERSFAAFNRAVNLDPTDSVSIHLRAYLYYKMGDYDTAVSELARALKMNPRLQDLKFSKVVAEENKKDWALRIHPATDD